MPIFLFLFVLFFFVFGIGIVAVFTLLMVMLKVIFMVGPWALLVFLVYKVITGGFSGK